MIVRVIALLGFTDEQGNWHPYGHEFDQPQGAQLDGWLKAGHVRVDQRVQPAPAPEHDTT